ncbi:MAG: YdeI/OmpD-associated family protein [Bacteroidota bacterium]
MEKKETEKFCPGSRQEWREWLEENHSVKQSVQLVYYKKKTNISSITWREAVDEALCFGWIDSTARPIDSEKSMQYFSRRKPGSTWSKVNKEKVKQLIDAGLMARAGFESIEIAKRNGSWTILDDVEELIIPPDLDSAFELVPGSKEFFLSLSKSGRKIILQWIHLAKRPETRLKRINETVERAGEKLKPGWIV